MTKAKVIYRLQQFHLGRYNIRESLTRLRGDRKMLQETLELDATDDDDLRRQYHELAELRFIGT